MNVSKTHHIFTSLYRFGMNGYEADDEIKGIGNSYDFGARIYDSRVGRFLSLDPLFSEFPFTSPFCYALNNPILFVDDNGEGPGDPPIIKFDGSANSKVVSAYALKTIMEIGQEAHVKTLFITSTYRDPERQIQIMYYNCSLKNGVSKGYNTYGKRGGAVVKTYEESVKKGLTKEQTVAEMFKTAEKVGFRSDHSNPNYSSYNVVDISYRNLSEKEYQALKKAAQNDPRIKVVLGREEGDNALHIEIPVPNTVESPVSSNDKIIELPEVTVNVKSDALKLKPIPVSQISLENNSENSTIETAPKKMQ